ncbi:hypothetical protein [Marinobacter nauticus]|uniref:hypothetical protein n=1 Tax=Marinobacter nauticus TaxID=2743 RepID=UPI001CFDF663|nr:hypothetical protein [Marinobacter nauticus]
MSSQRYPQSLKKGELQMDLNILIGLFCLGFGLYTLVARQFAPHKLAKLGPMKEKFGKNENRDRYVIRRPTPERLVLKSKGL